MFFLTGSTNWTLIIEIACAAVILFVVRSLMTRVQAHHRALDDIRKSLDEITHKLELLSPPTEAFENEDELEALLDRAQNAVKATDPPAAPVANANPTPPREEKGRTQAVAEDIPDEEEAGTGGPADDVRSLKLAELRELCRKRGLSMSGSRAELIDRLSSQEPRSTGSG